jgi:N-acetyl-anhydromuramyl-L-alanine amidase AmpD
VAIADLPYLHALGDGGPRSKTTAIVIHATDNTANAHDEASYATHRTDKTSAHFYVDDSSVYRALPIGNIAYGCLYHGNQISVQLELCGRSNQITAATMREAAPVVAELCHIYGLPVQKINASQVAAGVRGICGHADITAAFPQDGGDHTDPGAAFPWATFIGYVQNGEDTMSAQAESILSSLAQGLRQYTDNNGKSAVFVPVADIYNRIDWQQSVDAKLAQLASPTVTLTDADRADIAAKILAQLSIPSAADIAEELARRIGNG